VQALQTAHNVVPARGRKTAARAHPAPPLRFAVRFLDAPSPSPYRHQASCNARGEAKHGKSLASAMGALPESPRTGGGVRQKAA